MAMGAERDFRQIALGKTLYEDVHNKLLRKINMTEPDEESWKVEAQAVMADIRDHVESVSVSTVLPSSCKRIYINLTTFEKSNYCVELTGHGFRIVGKEYDCTDDDHGEIFETPYSLLDSVSPKYRNSFGKALENKLTRLKECEKDEGS